MRKKDTQLGMNASTASNRLVKDLLFKFATDAGNKCYRCGGDLTRDTFSIEHKQPWIDSNNPTEVFFDLGNIAFSHFLCNSKSAKRRPLAVCGTASAYDRGCRCDECRSANTKKSRKYYRPDVRAARHQKIKLTE
jgi:hypothetical protein